MKMDDLALDGFEARAAAAERMLAELTLKQGGAPANIVAFFKTCSSSKPETIHGEASLRFYFLAACFCVQFLQPQTWISTTSKI